ncbi:hypothetical protein [Saliphagus infecundisoli]|uniref:Uncharacterized protein n=2 Tax=Saliphagus infecundisoli TaxID=1849069 RepID=A0ABD5QKG6_9EURY|nr:hypothetical protein [Saliphagus infecundisoli]
MKMEEELTEDEKHTLETVVEESEPRARDIHRTLIDRDDTRFEVFPEWGSGYNQERRDILASLDRLNDKGFIEGNGPGNGWSPSKDGRDAVSDG